MADRPSSASCNIFHLAPSTRRTMLVIQQSRIGLKAVLEAGIRVTLPNKLHHIPTHRRDQRPSHHYHPCSAEAEAQACLQAIGEARGST